MKRLRLTAITLIACYIVVVASCLGTAPDIDDVSEEYIACAQATFQAHKASAHQEIHARCPETTIVIHTPIALVQPIPDFIPYLHPKNKVLVLIHSRPPDGVRYGCLL